MIALLLLQMLVTDGDTLKAPWGESFRLHGIDAPEIAQQCERDGAAYPCGLEARAALEALLEGKDVVCEPVGKAYARTVAVCRAHGEDIGEEMVRLGWALDYPRYSKGRYGPAENEARTAGRGLWRGGFMAPWKWRKR